MAEMTPIEWTDASWTPIRAKVRPDAPALCRERGWTDLLPIAERMVGRVGPHCEKVSPGCAHCYSETNNSRCLPYNGTGLPFDKRSRALIDAIVDEKILEQPLHWKRPRKIFVCSQTDLFGEWVPFQNVWAVYQMMQRADWHTYQILTKRADRLLAFTRRLAGGDDISTAEWPRQCWLGVTAENQEQADKRIPALLQVPAALRFVSVEPMLGPVSLRNYLPWFAYEAEHSPGPVTGMTMPVIDWVIVGGESGSKARLMHPDHARGLRDQCVGAGVPYFFKQWGEWLPVGPGDEHPGSKYDIGKEWLDGKVAAFRVGKKSASAMMDGRTWKQLPEVLT